MEKVKVNDCYSMSGRWEPHCFYCWCAEKNSKRMMNYGEEQADKFLAQLA